MKVTSEGKSGCGLTLYSSGTSRSKRTIGKKQHFRQFTSAGLLFQMAGRHTLFPGVSLFTSLGNAQVLLGGVYRVHIWLCIPSASFTPVATAAGLVREMTLGLCSSGDQSPTFASREVLLQSRARWSEEGRHTTFLSLSSLDAFLPSMCMCSLF